MGVRIASDEAGCPITKEGNHLCEQFWLLPLSYHLTTGCGERMEPPPITERFAPAEGYTTHEALKAIFRHYADLGRKPRDGVERGVDRTQWAKLVSESPDLPARLATADADLVFAKVAASAEINQCVRPAWRYYLLLWPPRRSARVLGVLARGVLGLLTRTFDFRTGGWTS